MKILHVVPCANEANGVYHVARMLAKNQSADGHEATVVTGREFSSSTSTFDLHLVDEVYVHGMWLPSEWRSCLKVIWARRKALTTNHQSLTTKLIRMIHGSLSPIYLEWQGKWKKRIVAPVERWLFSKADRVVTTGDWETEWCRRWGLKNEIETVDIKQFFDLTKPIVEPNPHPGCPLKVLYLGHKHPLKGIQFLEQAIAEVNYECMSKIPGCDSPCVELHVVSETFGEALEKEWQWADVLCLPTLSENFGLVVGEALERGKPVITTDGAPAWEPPKAAAVVSGQELGVSEGRWRDHLVYLKGYRDGSDEYRIHLLKDALSSFIG